MTQVAGALSGSHGSRHNQFKATSAFGTTPTAGFSLVEICMVLMLMGVLGGWAVINITGMLPGINANQSMHQIVALLRNGRELAMAQRRNIQILFSGNNQIQLVRHDLPSGSTVLQTVKLEHGNRFRVFSAIPDTPDLFGNATAVQFGTSTTRTFLSDGTLVDENGDPLSGSIFIGFENHPETARAITILGATGRVRSYRWSGVSWIQ